MAVWAIPQDKIIDYSPTGDLTAEFAQKVKWCLENAYEALAEIHESITGIGGISVDINDIADGQILVYRAASQSFKNEDKDSAGAGKTLTLSYGNVVLAQYNGSEPVTLNLRGIAQDGAAADTAHVLRLLENLYLTLEVAGLNPGGYDRLSNNTFFGGINDIDGDRSRATLVDGKIYGNGAVLITKPISFINEVTGEVTTASRANLTVKHRNVVDSTVTAEIAMRNATFVKDELLCIGDGTQKTIAFANTTGVAPYNFSVYFDGERQSNYLLDTANAQVTFTAPNGAIVTADYFYNWGTETFEPMLKTGTYPDYRNQARATTQFSYAGTAGNVATLRLTLVQNSGTATNEISATGTGQPQGFKLAHQAVASTIQVTPATATWQYDDDQNVIVITAPSGTAVNVSYQWEGKGLGVDSFACTFDE